MAPIVQVVVVTQSPNAARARALADELLKVCWELKESRKHNIELQALSSSAVDASKDQPALAEFLRNQAKAEQNLRLRQDLAARS